MASDPRRVVELPDLALRSRAYDHRRAAAHDPNPVTRQMHLALAAEFQRMSERRARPARPQTEPRPLAGGHRGSRVELIQLRERQ